jgi:glycosyltransferase involved in cell wall biosynthesis
LIDSFLFKKKSIQESIFWDKSVFKKIKNDVKSIQPDVVFADMIRTAQYFEMTDKFKIFDMDDLISKRYDYYLKNKDFDILGYFGEKLPALVNKLANTVLRRLILSAESKLVKKREISLVKLFDRSLLLSPIEANNLKNDIPLYANKIFSIFPSGVSQDRIIPDDVIKEENSISFMGLLNYPPNEKGLIYFLETIFPMLKEKMPKIHLYIIGKNATAKLIGLTNQYPNNITLTGFLDDPIELILKTQLLIAPVYFGTGIKIKILESMSIGIPIVTTEHGAEGLLVEDKKNILISTNEQEFLNNIINICNDGFLRDTIGKNGLDYINRHHNPSVLKKQFLALLNNDHLIENKL